MNESTAFSNIKTLRGLLDSGEILAVELTQIFAERINCLNQTSKAFISLDIDNALKQAEQLDHLSNRKILAGIPYACKDLFDVEGIATTGGSRVLHDNVATQDADCITQMNNAGAIFLGKNNLHEFAYGATGENAVYGTPPNPYDQTRLAGGSSSGSAAAVAYGLCSTALGTDTGGSVRAPAALCGLVGFKPTYGRISTEGVIPYSWALDHIGGITRCVADAALVFSALDGQRVDKALNLKNLTVGIPETFFFENADSEILTSIEQLMQLLTQAGATMKKVAMPSMEYTRTVSLTVQMPEALSYHSRYLESRGELYSPDFRAGLALAQSLLAEHYVRAKRFIETYRRDTNRAFAEVDVLLTPATPTIAPKIGVTEVSIGSYSEPAGNAITRYTSFFNMTGHPAITFPCGMHTEGLPMAAQLIGRHYGDEALLCVAQLIESALGFCVPEPDLSGLD